MTKLEVYTGSERGVWFGMTKNTSGPDRPQTPRRPASGRTTESVEPDRIEILKKTGLNCREVSKDIVAGVDRVRELFKQNRIHISPDCKNLIHELETYRYPDKKPDQNEQEKPVKENDHALDALRYALYMVQSIVEDAPDPYFEKFGTYYRD